MFSLNDPARRETVNPRDTGNGVKAEESEVPEGTAVNSVSYASVRS